MATHNIELEKNLFEKYTKNQDARNSNAQNMCGDFLAPLVHQLRVIEQDDELELQADKNRLYEQGRTGTNYWTIHAHCKACKCYFKNSFTILINIYFLVKIVLNNK